MKKKKQILKELPIYEVELKDSEDGVYCVSLVDEPAIQSYWLTMSEEKETTIIELSLQEDQQIVLGPVLIPNKKIYRKDINGNAFYIQFSEESIIKLREKFHKNQLTNVTNEQHSKPLEGNYAVDSYILNDNVTDERFKDLPKGTWMLSYKIEDQNYWNSKIKTGLVKGFSIEAIADLSLVKLTEVNEILTEETIELNGLIPNIPNPLVNNIDEEEVVCVVIEVATHSVEPSYTEEIEPTVIEPIEIEPIEIPTETIEEPAQEISVPEVTPVTNWEQMFQEQSALIDSLSQRLSELESLMTPKTEEQTIPLALALTEEVSEITIEKSLNLRSISSNKSTQIKGDTTSSIFYYLNK